VENRKKIKKPCMDQWKIPADDQRRQPALRACGANAEWDFQP